MTTATSGSSPPRGSDQQHDSGDEGVRSLSIAEQVEWRLAQLDAVPLRDSPEESTEFARIVVGRHTLPAKPCRRRR